MSNIVDRQTFVLSFNFDTLLPSSANVPITLRFRADEMVLKSISYSPQDAVADIANVVQIWCSKTNDQLIGSFPNKIGQNYSHDEHFRLSNGLQNEIITFAFQNTSNSAPSFSNPQSLISEAVVGDTKGILTMTVEFLKLANKEIY